MDSLPEVIGAQLVTGADCSIIKVLARSMRELERIPDALPHLGGVELGETRKRIRLLGREFEALCRAAAYLS